MSISPAQIQVIVRSGLFDDALRKAIAAISRLPPHWNPRLALQRDRSRRITRRKQRRTW